MTKHIVLCADDYGQSISISQGILDLVQAHRLSATSCMVNGEDCERASVLLRAYQNDIDIGLHFNLTEGEACSPLWRQIYGPSFKGLPWVMWKTLTRQLALEVVMAELNAQLNRFFDFMGCIPNMIDGHQHIHQFPVIRQALVNVYQQRLMSSSTYFRLVSGRLSFEDMKDNYKKGIIFAMGAKPFSLLLAEYPIPHNTSFSGIYPFNQSSHYRVWFQRFLAEIKDGGMVMCHPGRGEVNDKKSMAVSRLHEHDCFLSENFLLDCVNAHVSITRFGKNA